MASDSRSPKVPPNPALQAEADMLAHALKTDPRCAIGLSLVLALSALAERKSKEKT